ncbi:unnamed protein product, partial [Oncorhynchus mykiss]
MSGDSCQLPLHRLCLQTQAITTGSQAIRPSHEASQMACPKSKTCSYRAALGLGNKYVRLNVGGTLFYTTLQVLTRQDSMLKAMFSGKKEVFIDREGEKDCQLTIIDKKLSSLSFLWIRNIEETLLSLIRTLEWNGWLKQHISYGRWLECR